MAERMEVADGLQTHEPTPYAMEILEYNIHGSNQCMVIKAGGGEFEVLEGTKPRLVDILKGTCLCGGWQITGIPCKHACRAIFDNREQPVDYVHGFYRGQCYKLTYGEHMHPLPDKDAWPTFQFPQVLPSIPERSIGRPARQRKRKPDEPKKKGKRSTTITCSICKTVGHNARSCKGGPTAKQRKASGGNGSQKKRARKDGASTSKG
ncbi:uncharacterized protein LOC141627919 [Silene latifolia]|uniref:uncharacterized protein LOC141627919 n=1 Tax=Silene latifolia TaxID=37657 RepID=UPI003D789F0B